jgi:rare lipoprotein A
MTRFTGYSLVLPMIASLFLGGCAETALVSYAAKELLRSNEPTEKLGIYKVGNPYQIEGVWYYPKVEPDYGEIGIASWYGTQFHGKRTANGAIYDMNALTAAHRTLPMPFNVRVTNLDNGRSMVLTINDRGPYARGRIIDVSRRAAQLLGFEKKGTALVRVEAVDGQGWREPLIAVAEDPEAPSLPASPTGSVERQALTEEPLAGGSLTEAALSEVASVYPISRGPIMFIQAGAFANPYNAKRVSDSLAAFGKPLTSMVTVDGQAIYRVRLGPVATPEDAEALLERVIGAGHYEARLVVE